MSIKYHPDFTDQPSMDIIEAELEWELAGDDGDEYLSEIGSKYLMMEIQQSGEEMYPWLLVVDTTSKGQTNRTFMPSGYVERKCVDLDHAKALAGAFEREQIRLIEGEQVE